MFCALISSHRRTRVPENGLKVTPTHYRPAPCPSLDFERLGFQREGFLRERWHVNGEIQDAFFYGLLRREWLNE